MIRVVHPGSGSWNFTHPGSRIQGPKRLRIPDPDPQHRFINMSGCGYGFLKWLPCFRLGDVRLLPVRLRWVSGHGEPGVIPPAAAAAAARSPGGHSWCPPPQKAVRHQYVHQPLSRPSSSSSCSLCGRPQLAPPAPESCPLLICPPTSELALLGTRITWCPELTIISPQELIFVLPILCGQPCDWAGQPSDLVRITWSGD
jgi:hypothetical protein